MSDLTSDQRGRHAVVDSVLHLFRGDDLPATADVLAMAEWVADGSNSTAMALEGVSGGDGEGGEEVMDTDQTRRLESLKAVLALFTSWEEAPSLMDTVAMAEWVADGSVNAAAAAEGQRHALYREHVREHVREEDA